MKNAAINFAGRWYLYQKERFPVLLLLLGIIPATFSSGAVVSGSLGAVAIFGAIAGSLVYLLHIRIVDELRDFEHDILYHPTRPLQSGMISRKEPRYIDTVAMAVLLLIAFSAGASAAIIALVMLGYTYIAGKEFFVGEALRRRFFIYNGLNLLQMLLMQFFVYAIFAASISLNVVLLAHFLFTTVGTMLFEFVRKLKVPGDDGTGKDTYTYFLGFGMAHNIYLFLLALNTLLFLWIMRLIASDTLWVLVGGGCAAIAFLVASVHRVRRSGDTDRLMQLSFVVLYGIFNLVIYIAKLYV